MTDPNPRIRFIFSERKATEAAAHLLSKAGGSMNYQKLIKLLYLAEREGLARHRFPILGDNYLAMKEGPVLSNTLDLIKDRVWDWTPKDWPEHIARDGYDVVLKLAPVPQLLCKADRAILDSIWESLGRLDNRQLVQYTHDHCPEWSDPGPSKCLNMLPEDILQVTGASAEQIEALRLDVEAERLIVSILHDP